MRINHSPPSDVPPPSADTPPKKRRAPTPGVVPIPPIPARNKLAWSIKWRNPDTGRWKEETCHGCTSIALDPKLGLPKPVYQKALRQSVKLADRKRAISVHGRAAVQLITKEVEQFIAETGKACRKGPNKGKPPAPATVEKRTKGLALFSTWCVAHNLRWLSDLTAERLSAYRLDRSNVALKHAGEKARDRKMTTLNVELKPLSDMLRRARAQGRYSVLDSEAIVAALERWPEPKPVPLCMSTLAIAVMLRTLIDRDAKRYAQAAPVFAIGLLTGMRRGEIARLHVGLTWEECQARKLSAVNFREPSEYDPTQTHPVIYAYGKTGLRVVELLPYSPLLVELLHAMIDGVRVGAGIVDLDYEQIGNEADELKLAGGQLASFTTKLLRSTCCSYQGPLPGSNKAKADRQGHTEAEAERSYKALPKGSPLTAASLDEIMRLEGRDGATEMREVIRAAHAVSAFRAQRANPAQQRAK